MVFFKKKIVATNNDVSFKTKETEVLYTSFDKNLIIEGIELPENWEPLSKVEIKNKARQSILELSISSDSDLKAKELGFKNAEHLMQLCFDYILK